MWSRGTKFAGMATGSLRFWGGDQSLIVNQAEPDEVAGNLRDAFGDKLYGMALVINSKTKSDKRLDCASKQNGMDFS